MAAQLDKCADGVLSASVDSVDKLISKLNERIFTAQEILMLSDKNKKLFDALFQRMEAELASPAEDGRYIKEKHCIAYYNIGQYCELLGNKNESFGYAEFNLAYFCYEISAKFELKEAQNKVGELIYKYGYKISWPELLTLTGCVREAEPWFKKAADQGLLDACVNLGHLKNNRLYHGMGSYEEAIECYKKAATQGHREAQYCLARTYQDNWNNPNFCTFNRNAHLKHEYRVNAFIWYRAAAKQQHPESLAQLGWFYENNIVVDPALTEAQRLRLMIQCYRRAKNLGSNFAEVHLLRIYKQHLSNFANPAYRESPAFSVIERCLTPAARGVTPEYLFKFLNQLLDEENEKNDHSPTSARPAIECTLAECYLENFGLPLGLDEGKREQEAKKLLEIGELRRYPPALYRLAKYYESRQPTLHQEIFSLYLDAAERQHFDAAYQLFLKHEKVNWLERAARGGHKPAILQCIQSNISAAQDERFKDSEKSTLFHTAYHFYCLALLENITIPKEMIEKIAILKKNINPTILFKERLIRHFLQLLIPDPDIASTAEKDFDFKNTFDVFVEKLIEERQASGAEYLDEDQKDEVELKTVHEMQSTPPNCPGVQLNVEKKTLQESSVTALEQQELLLRELKKAGERFVKENKVQSELEHFIMDNLDMFAREALELAKDQSKLQFEALLSAFCKNANSDSTIRKVFAASSPIADKKPLLLVYELLGGFNQVSDMPRAKIKPKPSASDKPSGRK